MERNAGRGRCRRRERACAIVKVIVLNRLEAGSHRRNRGYRSGRERQGILTGAGVDGEQRGRSLGSGAL